MAETDLKEVAEIETANDDTTLDDVIAKALDGQEVEATAESGAARDERGRFKSSKQEAEGGTDGAAAKAPEAEVVATEETKPVTEAPVAPKWTDGHFSGWKPEQRERFAALPPDIQQLVMDRQAESQAFFQRKLAEDSDYKKATEPLYQAAKQIEPFANSIGVPPHELMRNYAAIDYKLRYAPYAEKVQLLSQIAKTYGVPFAQPETDPYADPLQPNGQAYPVIHDLQSQLAQTKAQLAQYRQQVEAQTTQQYDSQIQTFATATNADGTPKHPLFEVVAPAMGKIISEGKAATLEDAYALATKPLQEKLAGMAAESTKRAAEEQAKIVAKAKKAAPVRTSSIAPGGKTKGGGIDAILNQTLASHGL